MTTEERVFNVDIVTPTAACQVIIDSDQLEGMSAEEIKKAVINQAQKEDTWQSYESELDQVYEVQEE